MYLSRINELKGKNISVPHGFVTTAAAYRTFLEVNKLDEKIRSQIENYRNGKKKLKDIGQAIRWMNFMTFTRTSMSFNRREL
jgi:phosphoenolpyruvate synthase/pyruvate phosphate dikinase